MSRSWMLAAPAALALLVAGCATNPTGGNQVSPVANVGTAVGNQVGVPTSPNTPAPISNSLTNTEAQADPAPGTTRPRVRRSPTSNARGFGGTGGQRPSPTQSQNGAGS